MVQNFHLPPTGYGPGSQPGADDGAELEFIALPQDMRTYSVHVPEIGADGALGPALTLLSGVADAADRVAKGGPSVRFDLSGLDAANRALVAETMGVGEVAM